MKKNDKSETELLEIIRELELRQFELETQNKELILEKETAAKALVQQNDALSKLNRFSLELSQRPSEENPEVLITKRIKELTGGMMASFSEYNEESCTITLKHIETEPGILEKAINILGKNILNAGTLLTNEMYHELTTEIITIRRTLHEATFGYISRAAGAILQALNKIDRFILIAYIFEGRLFGASVIALYKNQPEPPREILIDFVSIASLSLRRKKADETLRESEEMYQTFLNSTEDMAFLKDENLRYVIINKANCNFFGKKQEDIIGLTDFDLMDAKSANSCSETDKKSLLENKIFISEEKVGGHIYETRKFPVKMRNGKQGVGGYIRDITAQKDAEAIIKLKNEELIRVNTEKDKFFSIIAHDLRSPFNAFLGFTEIMVDELDNLSITEIQNIALSMRNSATNLFQLLENLLEWSRLQRGLTGFNPKSILLLPGITDSLQSVFESAVKKEIDIKVDIPNDLVVFADENMLGSIVRNLAFNAVKFTLKGGKINISARAVLSDLAEISVKDSGIGMSEDIQENLFSIKEHSTRSGTDGEPSTGLGLIICKEFVEEHGGKIWGNSQNGKGSEFKFTLPLFIGQVNQPVNN